jgi:tripartite-type tricarboxylate transporter receptor subunit TctC
MTPKAALVLALLACAGAVQPADAYPDRPVRVIVPYAAGGPTDVTARIIMGKLSERLGQQFAIDNRGGAGGNIGTAAGAAAAPDGYTIVFITPAQVINMTFFANPGYDLARDFQPIALLTTAPALLIAHPKLGATSLAEVIALARAKPGTLTFATAGVGVAPHLMMEMIKKSQGIDMVHVPYRGGGPALNDTLAGQVPLMMDSIVTGLPHVRAGTLRGIAVSTARRSPLAPDIPTIAESGIEGFDSSLWYGVVAPAKTRPEMVARLSAEIAAVMKLPEVRERLLALGSEPADSDPARFADFLKGEAGKWGEVVRAAGVKAE